MLTAEHAHRWLHRYGTQNYWWLWLAAVIRNLVHSMIEVRAQGSISIFAQLSLTLGFSRVIAEGTEL